MKWLVRALVWPVAIATVPAQAAAPPPLPIADFAQLPFLRDPVLSPDGGHVAARLLIDGKVVLAILSLEGGAAKRRAIINIEKTSVIRYSWAGNGKLLVSLLVTAPVMGFQLPATSLIAYDLPSQKITALSKDLRGLVNDTVIFIDPAGQYVLVSGQKRNLFENPSVFRIDTATGKADLVQSTIGGIDQWFADPAGVVRAGLAYDGPRWKLFYRDQPAEKLRQVDSRQVRRDDDSVVDAVRFMGNATQGAVITNGKTGRFGAYKYDFTTDTIGEVIFEHADVDASELIMSADGSKVEGVAYEDDRSRIEWLDAEKRALQQRLDKALPGKLNRVIGSSADGGVVLFWSGGANDPGGYFLFDAKLKRVQNLVRPYDRIKPENLSEVKAIAYPARDGLSIAAYLTLPHDRKPAGLPLVIMPHGGPFLRDSWDYNPWAQMLADRGFAVLQPNFRGSTGYGKAFVEKGYGQWGLAMQDDLDDGMDWLVKQGIADPERVCIMGASYGGYAAIWGAIRNPDRYRCAVSMAGVTDLRMMLRYDKRQFAATRYARRWESRVAGEEKRDLDAVSPLVHAKRLSVPLLLVHGEKDNNVPYIQASKLRDALVAAGKPVEFVPYPDEGHGFVKTENNVDFMKRVEAFMQKNNPSD